MATKSPQPRARVVVDEAQSQAPQKPPFEDTVLTSELVTAIIPRRFTLTLDDGAVVVYDAGTREIPRSHAEHWWSRVQGVTIYTKEL